VLVVSGDFEIDQAKVLVEKYFGDIPARTGEIYRPNAVEPKRNAEIRDTVYDNIQLPAIIHAYPIPAMGTPDFYAMEMLSTLLSRGQSSRLYRKLVDKDETALTIQAIPLGLEDPGLLIIFGIPNIGVELETLEAGFVAELEKMKTELISENEFQKLRNQMESQFVSGNTTIASRSTALATYHLLHGDANKINTELDLYMAVTRQDIQRVARKYLIENNRVVLFYLPQPTI
jgi:zinc protease